MHLSFHKLLSIGKENERLFSLFSPGPDVNDNDLRIPDSVV